MRILFYTPLNTRCRDLESQAAVFARDGHSIFLLTQSPRGALHENFDTYGYLTSSSSGPSTLLLWTVLRRIFSLVTFCRKHRINLIYAHLEPANFIAALAQYFMSARVVICRHHIDEARLYGFDRTTSYRLTYRLARTIVVVSAHARRYMTEAEHIPSARIHVIPLAYDFRLYELPPTASVHALKDSTVGKLRLVDVCRLTRFKRPELLIALARQLADWNIPFRLTILGAGELEPALRQLVTNSRLEDYVELPGYVPHVLTYLAAADLFVHPSLLESSCISVKEAGLVNLPVVVCRGVGDFDDTLTDGIDAFLVDPDDFVAQAAQLVRRLQMDRQGFALVGEHLQQTIRSTFDIEVVAKAYEPFHQP